ncbi:hypothetical protein HMPREF1318_1361 [Actinomyces massiliensis F0489]|uniref:Uncharacterized protein n=1 Tax=Actinomyces massiliensis F0489 TaxID=1125718 RepID=J1HPB3_9ACTO|nr:hypothetical protein HMPREF1318_1361 [Actinomyces massiliensis F0489]
MQGHWLLARLGKRVLRPGGMGLTRRRARPGARHAPELPPAGRTAQRRRHRGAEGRRESPCEASRG